MGTGRSYNTLLDAAVRSGTGVTRSSRPTEVADTRSPAFMRSLPPNGAASKIAAVRVALEDLLAAPPAPGLAGAGEPVAFVLAASQGAERGRGISQEGGGEQPRRNSQKCLPQQRASAPRLGPLLDQIVRRASFHGVLLTRDADDHLSVNLGPVMHLVGLRDGNATSPPQALPDGRQ